ncbi:MULTISPECIES: aminodeoxychorismate synthase component I [unclassified Gordonia (in: high G+C Gram-positive bacteria)]|uniref:aminodeoxychorismate synthase component I n=1 Tax=unclassified Gordonia (in: high G+C Gram-positive bacteria) TaxID=2657482 RepID=UPI001F0FB03E|nr:aminodeoxychorismate synthase component I [Gordonia sp. ABSL49_1]MCH5641956.1 aminodeoxychorismate synthase component I [Gordonia sp. ABSL49_1]
MVGTALDVLRALSAHTAEHGVAPPAALVGEWWDADAVIAPSIELRAGVRPPDNPDRYWLGYLGFPVHNDRSPLPTVVGGLTDHLLILRDGVWETIGDVPPWALAVVAGNSSARPARGNEWHADWVAPQRDPHLMAIERCLAAIRAGEVYQACVCTQFTGSVTGNALDYFADLTAATAPAKAAFLQGSWGSVASFSPELFLRRTGNIVSSAPIKGTIAGHDDPNVLSSSVKDVAENIMIVDLTRNDLGRLAVPGSVRVPELLSIMPAPGVWHLVSRVQAILEVGTGNDALLAATFPPPSVTGTPKLRALELLSEWESAARGVYCGAVGIAGPGGELDLNVAIRTVAIAPDGRATLGVGGGITIDSDPLAEWQECLDKAASIVQHSEP